MAALTAPVLAVDGKKQQDASLEAAVFGVDVKPHLLHETVRAELNARRAGTRGAKSRGLVAGGRAKPFRQKGTGRARAGTTRAPQWTGGGVAFPPTARSFEVKVNRKVRRAAFRGALSEHAKRGSMALVDPAAFPEPSSSDAAGLLAEWGAERPVVVVAAADDDNLIKSFRNLERVLVVSPSELEVASLLWARSLLISAPALEDVQGRAR